jgi:hypothetical protein
MTKGTENVAACWHQLRTGPDWLLCAVGRGFRRGRKWRVVRAAMVRGWVDGQEHLALAAVDAIADDGAAREGACGIVDAVALDHLPGGVAGDQAVQIAGALSSLHQKGVEGTVSVFQTTDDPSGPHFAFGGNPPSHRPATAVHLVRTVRLPLRLSMMLLNPYDGRDTTGPRSRARRRGRVCLAGGVLTSGAALGARSTRKASRTCC